MSWCCHPTPIGHGRYSTTPEEMDVKNESAGQDKREEKDFGGCRLLLPPNQPPPVALDPSD